MENQPVNQIIKTVSKIMKCTQCECDFEREVPPELTNSWFYKLCQKCLDENAAVRRSETEKRDKEIQQAQWKLACPSAFQETNMAKLPLPEIAQRVLGWEYNSKGLILYGGTRKGKTRSAWMLIKKLFMQGRNFRVMDSMSGFEYAGIFSEGGNRALDWVRNRSNVQVLFLDDVFKVKLTDSFEAALFAIVDHRMNHQLPIIATLNDVGETLASRMTGDRGNPFVARLREMCETIVF